MISSMTNARLKPNRANLVLSRINSLHLHLQRQHHPHSHPHSHLARQYIHPQNVHNANICAVHFAHPISPNATLQSAARSNLPLNTPFQGLLRSLHDLSINRTERRRTFKMTEVAKFRGGDDRPAIRPQLEVQSAMNRKFKSRQDEKTGENPYGAQHSREMERVGSGVVETSVTNAAEVAKTATNARADGAMDDNVMDVSGAPQAEEPPEDIVILYQTLVKDDALPAGYEREFATLAKVIAPTASAGWRTSATWRQQSGCTTERRGSVKKRRSCSRRRRSSSGQRGSDRGGSRRGSKSRSTTVPLPGETRRKQRDRGGCTSWQTWCATRPRQWGQLLAAQPGNVEVLDGGKRASTLRSRARAIRKFLTLHVTHSLSYPQTVEHYADYLRMRLSEPCNRGALKTAHHALVFLSELTGTQVQDQPTATQLYSVICRELLTAALPGRASKQAPTVLVSMLSAVENVVTNQQVLPFVRVYAWWVLVQNWVTLRFSGHRGIEPSSVAVTGGAFSAVLARSKTVGVVLLSVTATQNADWFQSPAALSTIPS